MVEKFLMLEKRIFHISVLASVLMVVLCHLPADAQLRYGIRFGGFMADASMKNAKDFKMVNRSGFTGGLMLEYTVPETSFAIDLAAVYTRYSTKLGMPGGGTMSFGRNFIDFPLHFKYKFWLHPTHDLVAPMVYTGPSLMVKTDRMTADALMTTQRFQPGWDVGLGIDIINFIQITAGYRFGLGNAVKSFKDNGDPTLRTNGWNVSVSLLLDF